MSKEEDNFILGDLEILDIEIDDFRIILAGLLKMIANGQIRDKMFIPKLCTVIKNMSEEEFKKYSKFLN